MSKILIVDNDPGLLKILELSLKKYENDFEVLFAGDGEEAVKIFENQTIDLLVTCIIMPKMDGFALLSYMSANYSTIPCIVLTSYNLPGLKQKLSKSVFHFLKKPVDSEELAELILKGLKQRENSGVLDGVSVPSLMQIIEVEEKSCLLVLHSDGKKQGAMYFQNGELYDAVYGELGGEDAALQLIALENMQMEYRKLPSRKIHRRIEQSIQTMILESMRIKDENEAVGEIQLQEKSELKTDLLAEGIRLCEGLHLQEAQKFFLQTVSQDSSNALAFLWLSRTLMNMKQIRVTIGRAYKLEPKNLDVVHDIHMFDTANKLGLQQVRRCPFCYAPIAVKVADCNFCGVSFGFDTEKLAQIEETVNRDELHKALSRFENVLTREINRPVLFYATLACMYLGNFDKALQYLELLQKIADVRGINYKPTVERILAFIASERDMEVVDPISEAKTKDAIMPKILKQKKILVVEDSPTTRKVIKMTLQNNNFNVIEAEDGVEALTKINDEQPDLILLDVMLPKLDGYSVLSLLKQQNGIIKKTPVIMLTSKDGLRDRIKGRFSASSAYLTKPFKPDELIKTVNKFI
ncbi:MAG: response regulator [Desulfobacterales bacterium]|nr:response regulator [Desulfobacterales bacterium]